MNLESTMKITSSVTEENVVGSSLLFLTHNAIWLVPTFLVILQLILKLVICERPSFHESWKSFLHSPVDAGFLALSFTATIIMSHPNQVDGLLTAIFIYLVCLILSITIWKFSPQHTTPSSMLRASGLLVLNFLVTGTMLVHSVALLMRA